MHGSLQHAFLGAMIWLWTLPLWAQVPADQVLQSLRPTADVNDYAGILTSAERDALEQRCKQLREKTGAQLAVVILKSLGGGQIDDFANKLFARWGIGEKGKNNGLLLLVALDDRKARLEVGYGLEPILPDALAGRILDEHLFPDFKRQQYFAGLQAAVNRAAEIIERGEPATAADRVPRGEQLSPLMSFGLTLFFALFVAIGAFVGGAGARQRNFGMILFALLFVGVPLLMGCVMAAPWAPLLHLPLGIVLAWLGWRSDAPGTPRRGRRSSYDDAWPDTWTWGTLAGGLSDWSSGSSDWGGGFSSDWGGFGGGSSGGGGASGGW